MITKKHWNKLSVCTVLNSNDYRCEFAKLNTALKHEGIVPVVRLPVQDTLVVAVGAYIRDPENEKTKLWGKPEDGNGTAYADFNNALPIYKYNTGDELTSLDTHKALIELTRYHQDSLRKSGDSILSHLFETLGVGVHTLGDNLRTVVTLINLMHDLAEDGGRAVAHKDASLTRIVTIHNPFIASLIAEMTDGFSDYYKRAEQATADHSTQYRFADEKERKDYLEKIFSQLVAEGASSGHFTDQLFRKALENTAFSISTAGPKLGDVLATICTNLSDPDMNEGYWRGSGARIGWIVDNKGFVANELYASIAAKVQGHFASYQDKRDEQILPTGHKAGELNRDLLVFLHSVKEGLDRYTMQNLVILADEFKLSNEEREQLVAKFTDTTLGNRERLREFLDNTLTQERLDNDIKMDSTTLYEKGSKPGNPLRSYENLFLLQDQFQMRETYRKSLHSLATSPENTALAEDIIANMSPPDFKGKPFIDDIVHYDRKMGKEPRISPQQVAELQAGVSQILVVGGAVHVQR